MKKLLYTLLIVSFFSVGVVSVYAAATSDATAMELVDEKDKDKDKKKSCCKKKKSCSEAEKKECTKDKKECTKSEDKTE